MQLRLALVGVLLSGAAMGCGDDDNMVTPDGTSDASLGDASVPDAEPEPVTVTVYSRYDDGVVLEGAAVAFHDPDGTVASEALTDVNGQASADMPDGGHVTVWHAQDGDALVTIVGVEPGDDLVVGDPTPPDGGSKSPPLGTVTVTLPGPAESATSYYVDIGCTSYGVEAPDIPVVFDVYEDCAPDGAIDLLVIASDVNGAVVAHSGMLDVAVSGATPVTMPAWSTDIVEQDVTITNASNQSYLYARASAVRGRWDYWDMGSGFGDISGGVGMATLRYLAGFGGTHELQLYESFNGNGERFLFSRTAAPPADRTINMSTDMLPRVEQPAWVAGMIAWVTHGVASGDDGTWVRMTFYRPLPPEGTGNQVYWDWEFALPPGANSVTPPTLPESWGDLMPNELSNGYGDVYVIGADFIDARDFRERAATGFAYDVWDGDRDILPPVGEVRLSTSETGD